MVVDMYLNPEWKKTIIPIILESIFTKFTREIYIDRLAAVMRNIHAYTGDTTWTAIRYKSEIYTPYANPIPNKAFPMMESMALFHNFNNLLQDKAESDAHKKIAYNYLASGLAMCKTVEDLREVFPETILSIISAHTSNISTLYHKPTTVPKFQAFIEKNKHIEKQLNMQLAYNMIAPGHTYEPNKL